jgi:cobalt-zinc-cadmium efflux system outer membrane protein
MNAGLGRATFIVTAMIAFQIIAPPLTSANDDPYGLDAVAPRADAGSTLGPWLERLVTEHPALRAAERRLDAADARAEGARGAFDFELTARAGVQPVGKYDEAHATLAFDQPTPWWGLRMRGGYRQGADFPFYKGGSVTGEAGEFFLDLSLPLWRDRAIDSRRFKVASAELKRENENLKVAARRLELSLAAVQAYWSWVQRLWDLRIAQRLLEFATVREGQIGGRVRSGQAPAIDAVDNTRLVLARRARVAQAEARVAQARAELAVFRADWGPDDAEPPAPPDLPEARMDLPDGGRIPAEKRQELKTHARTARPDLAQLRQLGDFIALDLQMAENALGPRLDLKLSARQDLGGKRPIGVGFETAMATEVGVGVEFALPVQQREARAELAAIRAERAALDEDIRLAEARVDASLEALLAELDATAQRAELALGAYRAAVQLERAERRSFELGQSTLVVVNLREEATAEAALALVEARSGWLVTMARLMVTAGYAPGAAPLP